METHEISTMFYSFLSLKAHKVGNLLESSNEKDLAINSTFGISAKICTDWFQN